MSERERFEVVVGADGTGSSLHAVKWAASEATSRDGSLRIVHAAPTSAQVLGQPEPRSMLELVLDSNALRLLEVASLVATTMSPGLEVSTELHAGAPAEVLCTASRDADLLVLGDRGPGGCTGTLVGAVAAAVADLATCPVLIVRGRVTHSGPVVVGLDGSGQDASVLAAAFDRAERAQTSMLAVHAFHAPPTHQAMLPGTAPDDEPEQVARNLLDDALAPFAQSHPSVQVETSVIVCAPTSSPTAALVSASAGAQLVVVGAYGANAALRGLLSASACCDDDRHAHCPVEVIRLAAA